MKLLVLKPRLIIKTEEENKVLRNMLTQGAAKLNLSPRPSTEYDTMEWQ